MAVKFDLVSRFKPAGDQPQAIASIVEGFRSGRPFQTLLLMLSPVGNLLAEET
jgi:excinuclease ABC subunit B